MRTTLDEAIAVAAPIVADVRENGDAALAAWTKRLDGRVATVRVPGERIGAARVDDDVATALRRMIEAVERFSEAQRLLDTSVEAASGIVSERRWLPVDAVGVCAERADTTPVVAGDGRSAGACCRRSPHRGRDPEPGRRHSRRRARARDRRGLRRRRSAAVAALAYGTDTIAPVDAIVGPGNAYVTAAKLLVSSRVKIDLPAGPSEVVVIADATASARQVAADLLAQAEHGEDSDALLLTDDDALADAVEHEVASHANVRVERFASLDEALARSEAYAPEHLELHVADPALLLSRVRNAGCVFIGCSSVIGDYAAGATHVLPTGGLARSTGGLGLETFLKPLQVVTATGAGKRRAAEVVGPLARVEGLPLHARAVAA